MIQGKQFKKRSFSTIRRKPGVLLLSLIFLFAVAVSGTIAYLVTHQGPLTNTFTPSAVTCEVTENFDSTTNIKSNVNVNNTGDTEAYIRVRLVTYRVNEAKEHIGGTATIPESTPGYGWFEQGGYYYYSSPVAAGKTPEADLIGPDGITLAQYTDADGGKQVVEVLAEAIQSTPTSAVTSSWGVTVNPDGTLKGGN